MTTNWQGVSQQDFSQDLLQKLGTCMTDNNIYTLWLGIIWKSSTLRGLWMHVKDKNKTEAVFSAVYKKTVVNEERILLVVLDNADFAQQTKIGNILFKTCLIDSHIIYQTSDTSKRKPTYKSLAPYIALYQDKQALLTSYCTDFVTHNYRGSSLAFLKSFTYNLDVLEMVLLGIRNTTETLTHRLLILEQIVPKMKTLFVKREADVYYMLNDLAQDIEDVDYTIWNEALLRVQKKLYHLVLNLLEQLDGQTTFILPKRQIRKTKCKPFKYKEKLLSLLETNQVEELYQFHEILYLQQQQQYKQVFLLVITKEKPSKTLKKIMAHIEAKQEEIRFTLLVHTRFYIQDCVYEFSDFFKKALQPKNRIYASDYYPQIHWYKSYMHDYTPFAQRYEGHLKQVNQTIQQDFKTTQAHTFITTHHLHLCLTTKLHLYLLHHLHYLPHTKNLNTLVNMTLYTKDKEASTFKILYDTLYPLVFAYTEQHKENKKYNLVLSQNAVKQLQQFFTTLEVQ